MAYKISGTTNENSRIIVIKQSDWTVETTESGILGNFEIDTISGSKVVVARNSLGKLSTFGNITAVEQSTSTTLIDYPFDRSSLDTSIWNEYNDGSSYSEGSGYGMVSGGSGWWGTWINTIENFSFTGKIIIDIEATPLSNISGANGAGINTLFTITKHTNTSRSSYYSFFTGADKVINFNLGDYSNELQVGNNFHTELYNFSYNWIAGQWYTFKITIDVDAKTFEFDINNGTTTFNGSIPSSTISGIGPLFKFACGAGCYGGNRNSKFRNLVITQE